MVAFGGTLGCSSTVISEAPARVFRWPNIYREPHTVTRSTKISLGILALSAWIIIPAALGVIGLGIADPGNVARVIDALAVLLGVGILMRREIARLIYTVLGVIAAALILLGSANASVGAVLVALVIQLVPVLFLMLGSVRDKFA